MTWDLWTFLLSLVGPLAVVIPAVVGVVVWISRRLRALEMVSDPRLANFLNDWHGEAERPGFPARPGIPARLQKVEEAQTETLGRLCKVEADTKQLHRNGGSHLADAVARSAESIAAIERHLQLQGGPP